MNLAKLKKDFRDRYSVDPYAGALMAALQLNDLYPKEGLTAERKYNIRKAWISQLEKMCEKYEDVQQPEAYYENDIVALADYMNSKFGDLFCTKEQARSGYEPGFRISHSQKSLSICLKHLWCLGKVTEPPQCPVDRIILRKAHTTGAWTKVNCIEEHRAMIQRIRLEADRQDLSLAVWELATFGDGSS